MSKRRKREKAEAERLHRAVVVRETARVLATGRPTLFRFESACRQGLRSGYCLQGERWAEADDKASRIVVLALHRIGASRRPTWSMGQPQRMGDAIYQFCRGCGGRMEGGSERPWCSDNCYAAQHAHAWEQANRHDDAARREAIRVILTGAAEPPPGRADRRCRHCDKIFTPKRADARYCSQACGTRGAPRRVEAQCMICASPFVSRGPNPMYCSPACAAEGTRRTARAAYHARRARAQAAETPSVHSSHAKI